VATAVCRALADAIAFSSRAARAPRIGVGEPGPRVLPCSAALASITASWNGIGSIWNIVVPALTGRPLVRCVSRGCRRRGRDLDFARALRPAHAFQRHGHSCVATLTVATGSACGAQDLGRPAAGKRALRRRRRKRGKGARARFARSSAVAAVGTRSEAIIYVPECM
jgi:hypothetical protein